jgi:putative transposase
MSRFKKLSQTILHCQYHVVWLAQYRFGVLTENDAREVERCTQTFSEQQGCEVRKLNVQIDYVHLLVLISPNISISGNVRAMKGRTAICILNKSRHLKESPY